MIDFLIFLLPTIIHMALQMDICVLYSSMEGGTRCLSYSCWHARTAATPPTQSSCSHSSRAASTLA